MADGHVEAERKYAVPDDWAMPDLGGLPAAHVDEPAEFDLDARYFDTDDLRLLRSHATLRCRHGGHDEGWHLKVPSGDDRLEVHRPLDADAPEEVPADLLALVRARARGQPLVPVARLRSRRRSRLLRDPVSGNVQAEVTEDEVTAEVPGHGGHAAELTRWREVEAELVEGDRSLLDGVERLLLESGAEPAPLPSKLRRALEPRLAALAGATATPATGVDCDVTRAADPVLAYVQAQVDQLAATDSAVRLREPEGIHDMRVATRRLRSVLRSFRRFFDPAVIGSLRQELAWLAEVLGRARDAEVLREGLMELVASQPAELVLGSVARRLDDELSATRQAGLRDVLEALNGDRYLALLTRLDEFVARPPVTPRGEKKPQRALRTAVRRDWRRVAALRDDVDAAEERAARDHALHEMRKAAKRARYTAELAAAGLGDTGSGRDAADLVKELKRMQDVLGEYQDTVVGRAELRRLGIEAHLSGENAFTFGRLHALEERLGDDALARLEKVWDDAAHVAERV